MRATIRPEDRFWAKVDKGAGDGCWTWTASCYRQGYGMFHGVNHRNVRAHRFVYELEVGPIPADMQIDPTCHDAKECPGGDDCPHRRCVNPAHLKPVTSRENSSPVRSNNHESQKTHCPHGHAYEGANLYVDSRNKRNCRACWRARNRQRKETNP